MTLQSKLTEIAELDKRLKAQFPSVKSVVYKVYVAKEHAISVLQYDGYTVVLEVKN